MQNTTATIFHMQSVVIESNNTPDSDGYYIIKISEQQPTECSNFNITALQIIDPKFLAKANKELPGELGHPFLAYDKLLKATEKGKEVDEACKQMLSVNMNNVSHMFNGVWFKKSDTGNYELWAKVKPYGPHKDTFQKVLDGLLVGKFMLRSINEGDVDNTIVKHILTWDLVLNVSEVSKDKDGCLAVKLDQSDL